MLVTPGPEARALRCRARQLWEPLLYGARSPVLRCGDQRLRAVSSFGAGAVFKGPDTTGHRYNKGENCFMLLLAWTMQEVQSLPWSGDTQWETDFSSERQSLLSFPAAGPAHQGSSSLGLECSCFPVLSPVRDFVNIPTSTGGEQGADRTLRADLLGRMKRVRPGKKDKGGRTGDCRGSMILVSVSRPLSQDAV